MLSRVQQVDLKELIRDELRDHFKDFDNGMEDFDFSDLSKKLAIKLVTKYHMWRI